MVYQKWKYTKKNLAIFLEKLNQQDEWLKDIKNKYKDFAIFWNENKSTLFIFTTIFIYRISTHYLKNSNYLDCKDWTVFFKQQKVTKPVIEIVTKSRKMVMKKAEKKLEELDKLLKAKNIIKKIGRKYGKEK